MKITTAFALLGLWVICSVPGLAQQVVLEPKEDQWLTLMLAMASVDPGYQQEVYAFRHQSEQERQEALQQVKSLYNSFRVNRKLNQRTDTQSPVVLLPLLYVQGEQLLPSIVRGVNKREHDEKQHVRYIKVHMALDKQGERYQLSVFAQGAAGVAAEGEHSIASLDRIIAEVVPKGVMLNDIQADDPTIQGYFQTIQKQWRAEQGLEPLAQEKPKVLDPVLAAHLQEKIKALSEAYHGRISGFTYCKLCESQPPASTLEHVELSLNASAGTLSGEITKYGQQRCLTAYYQDNQGSTIENVTEPEDFHIVQQEYNAEQHNLTAWINTKNGMATCTDYLALNNWDYCTQEVTQKVTDALVNAVTRCVEEEGLFSPETTDQPADNQEDSPIVKRLNQLIGEQEKIKIVDSEGTEIARSPDLATDQPEHFTVTIDANNQLSVKLTPDYLSSLGQTDPGALAALEQAFNDLLRQAKVSFCAGDTRSPDCTDQQLVFLQVLNLNVQSIALETQLHPAMWDSQNAKNHLIPSAHGLPPVATGVADALVERVSDLPQLTLMLGGLVINDDNQREALAGIFTAQGWQALKEGIFAELAATIRQQDKREHAVATASVNLVLVSTLYLATARS